MTTRSAPWDLRALGAAKSIWCHCEEKRIEYREAGVQEYWIIDRFRRTMTVYRWRNRRWGKQTIREQETYRTTLLPGFELPLAKLLTISDKYAD